MRSAMPRSYRSSPRMSVWLSVCLYVCFCLFVCLFSVAKRDSSSPCGAKPNKPANNLFGLATFLRVHRGARESGGRIRLPRNKPHQVRSNYLRWPLVHKRPRQKGKEDALRGSFQRPPPYTREQLHMCPEVVCMCRRVTLPSHARVNQICAYACDQKDRSPAPSTPI